MIAVTHPGVENCASLREAIALLADYGVVVVMDGTSLRELRDEHGGRLLVIHDEAPSAARMVTLLAEQAPLPSIFPIKEPKRARTHPNEPFYKGLKKNRREW